MRLSIAMLSGLTGAILKLCCVFQAVAQRIYCRWQSERFWKRLNAQARKQRKQQLKQMRLAEKASKNIWNSRLYWR